MHICQRGMLYRLAWTMRACIHANRYGMLRLIVTDARPWVAAIYRLTKGQLRPDPANPQRQKYWSQTDLARAADVRPNTLSEIINGREPSIATLIKIATALQVPVWTFFVTERQADLLNDQVRADAQLGQEVAQRERLRAFAMQEIAAVMERAIDRTMSGEPIGQSVAHQDEKLAPPRPRMVAGGSRKKR